MMENIGHVIVLGAGILQTPLIEEIKKYGGYSLVIDKNPYALGIKKADYFLEASTKEAQEIICKLDSLSFRSEITHCVTVGTDMTSTLAHVNEHLGLEGLMVWQSEVTSHKGKMRKFLKTAGGLPQPEFYCSSDKNDVHRWLVSEINQKEKESRFVLKPVDNMGARGVIYFENIMDISFAFELAQKESASQEIIVEEYIEGDEISVDALIYDGRCFLTGVADRIIQREESMYFVETGHNMPTRHNRGVIQKIQHTMQAIADALGSPKKPYHGPLKGDLKYTKQNNIIVGEVASRLSGGFMSTHTFEHATGVNLMKLYLNLITRNKTSFFDIVQNIGYTSVCIERSILAEPGQLKVSSRPSKEYFSSQKKENQETKLCEFFLNCGEGDIIEPVKNNVGKYAHVIIQSNSLENAEALWADLSQKVIPHTEPPSFTPRELRKQAVKKFHPKYCWACKICDGLNCASSVPGMGGVGNMQTFQENNKLLRNIKILPNYLNRDKKNNSREEEKITINTDILGISMGAPILTAPITGSLSNMGGSISEWEYAFETATAAKALGLIPTFGDGASPDKYWVGLKVIQKLGVGLPVFKPRKDLAELKIRINEAEEMGAKAWGMDVDGVWFTTMRAKAQKTQRKTYKELVHLKESSSLPFFLKGIMSISDAEIACEAGAGAIIISNHGGRVFDGMPATAEVLPRVADFVKKKYPAVDILVDGGIRSGSDLFKMIALGAKAVLIGRPIVIATVAYARFGVYDLLRKYIDEFRVVLKVMGLSSLNEVQRSHIR